MKHARDDYNRIQDPSGKIPEDGPVFLLRGQDQLACMAVAYYAALCEQAQSPQVAAKAREHADRMAAWPKKKVPDLPAPTSEHPITAAWLTGATVQYLVSDGYDSEWTDYMGTTHPNISQRLMWRVKPAPQPA